MSPGRYMMLLHDIAGAWDGVLAAVVATPLIPSVTTERKALLLILTLAGGIFSAGAGTSLFLAGFVGLPERVASIEGKLSRIERTLCVYAAEQTGTDYRYCYEED